MPQPAQKDAVARHRARQKRKGMVRVEVQVPRGDAETLRQVARTLRSDSEADVRAARRALQRLVRERPGHPGAKDVLRAMPEDLPLERVRSYPRDVDL